jgi:hypothetical protein
LLALTACKKKDNATADDPPPTGSSTTGTAAKPTTPTGDKRVTDSTTWTEQTGPGFTVKAPGPATHEKVAATKGARALDRYTFHKADVDSYVVEVTELPASADLGMMLTNMRMVITGGTQAVRHEDLIEGGEVLGRDIWYIVDAEDGDALRARSKLVGRGNKIYEVRTVALENEVREAEADKFVDSFALTPSGQ